ncbi:MULTISPECIES: DUF2953 domain-containing protein [Peribacillus]|uniref:DUF2953 domain-containing protein n=1 Tax=Peribacillus TaxID=2675229 RepID=UPI0024E1A178|nr:DUF2953 domain-containing protein [Peribacillus simplex]MDF9760172.1 uncharacterized membrane protein YjfL (UPF0719 family) [Peribacillus simplex]
MMWVLLIIGILILVLLILIFTKVRVYIDYKRVQTNDKIHIKLSAWYGLIHYTFKVPVIKKDDDSAAIVVKEEQEMNGKTEKEEKKKITPEDLRDGFADMKELLQHMVGFHRVVRQFTGKIQVKKFSWHSIVGTKNAAHTGVLTGACWALKGSIIGLLTTYFNFRIMPAYSITPDFQRWQANTSISCILQFRIGQAMVTGIKLLRYWKGGKPHFRSRKLAKLSGDSNKQSF